MPSVALKLPITASTQQHLDIEDVREDLVILKDGGVALVMETTAVNFGLLSETEQDAAIYAYAGLLNSLTFPIQIVIRNRRMDISSYVKLLKQHEDKQTNENLRFQISRYRQFIESIIRENNVLDKRFYIIIPFSPLELGAPSAATSFLNSLNPLSKKKGGLPYDKNYILEKARSALIPKKDHIIKQLSKIGVRATQLTTQELVELFYDIYNPTKISEQKITASVHDYTTPMVSPAVEGEEEDVMSEPTATPSAPSPEPEPLAPDAAGGLEIAPTATAPKEEPPPEPPGQPLTPADETPELNVGNPQTPQTSPEPEAVTQQPPAPSMPSAQSAGDTMPDWMKTVEEKVQKDQQADQSAEPSSGQAGQDQAVRSAQPNQQEQPRLARTQPQKPQQQSQVIGGKVATSPGQVSGQTNPNTPKRPQPPKPADLDNEQTVYSS